MQVIFLLIFLIWTPISLGLPWAKRLAGSNIRGYLLCMPLGYFLQTAVFQLFEVPFAWLGLSFSTLCMVFMVVIILLCVLSLLKAKREKFSSRESHLWSIWTISLMLVFIGLLIYQLINALRFDRTYMSYDDAYYVAVANDTLTHDSLFVYDAYTGLRTTLDIPRTIQSSLVFPAFLSFVSGTNVVMMEHTILDIYYLVLAYCVYGYMSSVLFEKLSDRFAFLILISIVFIYGNYSIYSLSMRLLGLNYVGKAILAFLFFPLLLSIMVENLDKSYIHIFGVLLLLLSISASGLTLFGTVTMIINVSIPVLISMLFKERQWKKLLYVFWGSISPVIYAGIYFVNRFLT